MTALITYFVTALVVSFLCSLLESVLLSISITHVSVLEKNGSHSGKIMAELKEKGLITEKEYEKKKKELLKRI